MNDFSVAAIIPTYNRAHCLASTLESVLSQTSPCDEIIVVDDGSTDDTDAVLARFAGRVEAVRQENAGVSAARNRAVKVASSTWVAFLDSDDLWEPSRVECLRRDLAGSNANTVVHIGNVHMQTVEGAFVDLFGFRGIAAPIGYALAHPDGVMLALRGPSIIGMAVRRDALLSVGGFDTRISIYEDLDLYFRLAVEGPWLVTADCLAVARRIGHGCENLTHRAVRERIGSFCVRTRVYESLARSTNLPAQYRRRVSRSLSGARFEYACALLEAGRRREGAGAALQSAREYPGLRGWLKVAAVLTLGARWVTHASDRRHSRLRRSPEVGQ